MVFKADLHIHTVLSPCGDLEMSPKNIVRAGLDKQLDIIAITDHNSTRQCRGVLAEAEHTPLTVFVGAEVTTKEEIHCLAYFETPESLDIFQEYLDEHLPDIKNNVELFGYQVVVNDKENIVYEEEKLLISAIEQSIDQVSEKIKELNGICVPAHIDKSRNSLLSQLGFFPPDLQADAFEISKNFAKSQYKKQIEQIKHLPVLRNSDAHLLEDIGSIYNKLEMQSPTFGEFRRALQGKDGRKIMAQ